MNQRLRSFGIWISLSLLCWVDNHIIYPPDNLTGRISWIDHLRWWLEGKLSLLFSWAYYGSAEEIEDAFSGLWADEQMTQRMRDAVQARRVYLPDPEINELIAQEVLNAEIFDMKAGFPPREWMCGCCGTKHKRGHFGTYGSHRCLRCGYVGGEGVMLLEEGRP